MDGPCKGCERRKVGCHNVDTCERWREYVKAQREVKARREEFRMEQEVRTEHLKRRGYKPAMR